MISLAEKDAAAVAKKSINLLLQKMSLPTLKTLMKIIKNAPRLTKDMLYILQKL